MGEGEEQDRVVLTVPGEPDFVTLVRLAARIVAGRAGHDDDARTQLQARAGSAFLAVTEGEGPGVPVAAHLSTSAGQVAIELVLDASAARRAIGRLEDAGIAHAVSNDGRTLHVTILG